LITGRLAGKIITNIVKRSRTPHNIDVLILPMDIAAFLTPNYIAEFLKAKGISRGMYDLIIVPGMVRGSCRIVEEVVGIRAVKGPRNAKDLESIIRLEDLNILSEEEPADEILQNMIAKKNIEALLRLEEKATVNGITIGSVVIPLRPPPMRIASEIAFAHKYDDRTLIDKVSKLLSDGADIVTLGFEPVEPHPDDVYRSVRIVKREFDVPVAIDTCLPSEIMKGIEAGSDIVLNIDLTNIDKFGDNLRETAIVVIPRDPVSGAIPQDAQLKVGLLSKAVEKAVGYRIEKVLADAVLNTPGQVFSSILSYSRFKELYPDIPMHMNISNVVEFMDVDSVGVNALLVMLAHEVGVSIVNVLEWSAKTEGSTREAKIASQMISLASIRGTAPTNIGLSLLILKDRDRIEHVPWEGVSKVIVASDEDRQWPLDPLGVFKIAVNHDEGMIEVLYIGRKGRILLKGKTARALRNEIVSRGLVSSLSHAIYLGIELAKAEIALQLGKNYVQECPLFRIPRPLDIRSSVKSSSSRDE